MTIDVRYGRCGRVFVVLRGAFDSVAAHTLHEVLVASDAARQVFIVFEEVRSVEPLALVALASESQVLGRSLTVMGLSNSDQRLLANYARQPRN
jgi:anti-anti-sigma regulatory factor